MSEKNNQQKESLLATMKSSKAIVKLAIPATLALLAKAVYNIVDTAYIGMLKDETALAAVGVTLPLLLIFVSIENIFAAGAAVLAGRQLGSGDKDAANTTVSTIVGVSVIIGAVLCVLGIIFMEPLLRMFGASTQVLPQAKDYAFWMFIAAIANIPAQSLNCAARAESSVKITSIAVITGALLNVILDPIFMFEKGFGLGVAGASIATTISQFVTAIILFWYYFSGKSIIKLKLKAIKPSVNLFKTVVMIGVPTAVVQICLAVSTSLTNMAAASLPESDLIIAAYGVVQRLVLVGHYVILGFMQGYQPVAAYSFGAKNEERFHESERFALKSTIFLTLLVEIIYILLSKPLIMLFNQNPSVVEYGSKLLISQVAIYPAFGICYLMTIIFQTIGSAKYGVFLSTLRQGLLYIPFILLLPNFFGILGIYLTQPIADILTVAICVFSYPAMKRISTQNIKAISE
ncbi:MATE family efflux transporter [Anaerocolumna aminovalerica]|uniref:MATE family efflux transporter n=1 Tax=Anaerocolumna aminovalerica TaxID=1527 RepID=UPI001C0F0904|nr:MATE family efflux transporter [Anaerocolumna aminovalerica]MBU5330865.1 MATE family efflux transporter [Anaerocolumna aminovalerica]